MTRAELGQRRSSDAWKRFLDGSDERRNCAKDAIRLHGVDRVADDAGVDSLNSVLKIDGPDDAVDEMRLHVGHDFGVKSMFHVARSMVEDRVAMRDMVWLHGAGQKLC